MLAKTLNPGVDKRRLRWLLSAAFLALALPTAFLIWQTYGQLKWEAFHQYRGMAEELTRRIDARLNERVGTADARSFADYNFLNVSGDSSGKILQRSPLSAFPVAPDLPGVVGYFQVDTSGAYSTPLLPPDGTDAATLGINNDEYQQRRQLAQTVLEVLADNRLVQSRPQSGEPKVEMADVGGRADALEAKDAKGDSVAEPENDRLSSRDAPEKLAEAAGGNDVAYRQGIFDELNRRGQGAASDADDATAPATDNVPSAPFALEQRSNMQVSDLELDSDLQKKSEAVENQRPQRQVAGARARVKRKEHIALPETVAALAATLGKEVAGPADLRISTFESEVDPFEFSLLNSGHFVMFRKVWRNGERYIQGLLIDRQVFIREAVGEGFTGTALADMSNLIVAYQDEVLETISGGQGRSYSSSADEVKGALLYRSRFTAPLDSLELVFSVNRMPPGPGASVLAWVTLVLAVVFAGVFLLLYRLGLSQISLARQQQDFVSAVSHELKSPLTSIRMYGEMLKEGWADEAKRQTYYEFIHDESERLSRLISNVLQLASITRNEPQFELKAVAVGELMSNIESKISNQVERAGFKLKVNRAEDLDPVTIDIDEDCFTQIVINLVDNAIKFSKNAEVRLIEISSSRSGAGRVVFSVRDYGPGIAKDQMKKIFRLFYRSESELTRETVGTGIGLAIVHQLAKAMNGSVDVVNKEPGTEFSIAF